MIIVFFFNKLKNFEIDIIKFEYEKIILNFDLNKIVRRRNAILTKFFENLKVDVIIKKTFNEKKKHKKSFRRRKRAIDERKHLLFLLIEHVLYKYIQKKTIYDFFRKFLVFFE